MAARFPLMKIGFFIFGVKYRSRMSAERRGLLWKWGLRVECWLLEGWLRCVEWRGTLRCITVLVGHSA